VNLHVTPATSLIYIPKKSTTAFPSVS